MAISFVAITQPGTRRLRLVFNNTLAAGAFGTTVTALYAITNQDGRGPDPNVNAALAIPGAPATVELALSADMANGAQYLATVTNVPAQDASTASGSIPFRTFGDVIQPSPSATADNLLDQVFGSDLLFQGTDFAETAGGDLATINGQPNVKAALERRLMGEGLAWDPSWGVHPRQYVDGTQGALPSLLGVIQQQMRLDDRVLRCKTSIIPQAPGNESQVSLSVQPVLLGEVVDDLQLDVKTS